MFKNLRYFRYLIVVLLDLLAYFGPCNFYINSFVSLHFALIQTSFFLALLTLAMVDWGYLLFPGP